MFKNHIVENLYLGIPLLIISLLPLVLPDQYKNGVTLTVLYVCFCLGIAFISDYLSQEKGKISLIGYVIKKPKVFLNFYFLMGVFGFVFELIVTYFGGLWWYPFYTFPVYFVLVFVLGGAAAYFLSIMTSYFAAKVFLDKLSKGITRKFKPYKWESSFFNFLGLIALISLVYVVYQMLVGTNFLRDFDFDISKANTHFISFNTVMVSFFGIWFGSEWIIFKKKRVPMISDLIHGYATPIIACYVAAIALLLYMELQNLPIKLWIYSKTPLDGALWLGLPVWIYLTWPLHYIALISVYRAFGDDIVSRKLLETDRIR